MALGCWPWLDLGVIPFLSHMLSSFVAVVVVIIIISFGP